MKLEEHIAADLAIEISNEIDYGIMSDLYESIGWTVVRFDRFYNNNHAVDITDWCVDNIDIKKWNNFGTVFLFEESKHAEWFSLRWL